MLQRAGLRQYRRRLRVVTIALRLAGTLAVVPRRLLHEYNLVDEHAAMPDASLFRHQWAF